MRKEYKWQEWKHSRASSTRTSDSTAKHEANTDPLEKEKHLVFPCLHFYLRSIDTGGEDEKHCDTSDVSNSESDNTGTFEMWISASMSHFSTIKLPIISKQPPLLHNMIQNTTQGPLFDGPACVKNHVSGKTTITNTEIEMSHYHPSTLTGSLCHVTQHAERPPSFQYTNSLIETAKIIHFHCVHM